MILSTSSLPDASESAVSPVLLRDTPNTVPRTAATAESVWIEKSLSESVSVRRCGASVQTSPRERRSCTLDARLLSSLYLREVSSRIVSLVVLPRESSEPSEICKRAVEPVATVIVSPELSSPVSEREAHVSSVTLTVPE